jgi:hypothetical protein
MAGGHKAGAPASAPAARAQRSRVFTAELEMGRRSVAEGEAGSAIYGRTLLGLHFQGSCHLMIVFSICLQRTTRLCATTPGLFPTARRPSCCPPFHAPPLNLICSPIENEERTLLAHHHHHHPHQYHRRQRRRREGWHLPVHIPSTISPPTPPPMAAAASPSPPTSICPMRATSAACDQPHSGSCDAASPRVARASCAACVTTNTRGPARAHTGPGGGTAGEAATRPRCRRHRLLQLLSPVPTPSRRIAIWTTTCSYWGNRRHRAAGARGRNARCRSACSTLRRPRCSASRTARCAHRRAPYTTPPLLRLPFPPTMTRTRTMRDVFRAAAHDAPCRLTHPQYRHRCHQGTHLPCPTPTPPRPTHHSSRYRCLPRYQHPGRRGLHSLSSKGAPSSPTPTSTSTSTAPHYRPRAQRRPSPR